MLFRSKKQITYGTTTTNDTAYSLTNSSTSTLGMQHTFYVGSSANANNATSLTLNRNNTTFSHPIISNSTLTCNANLTTASLTTTDGKINGMFIKIRNPKIKTVEGSTACNMTYTISSQTSEYLEYTIAYSAVGHYQNFSWIACEIGRAHV